MLHQTVSVSWRSQPLCLIEVPPTDGVRSLTSAGFTITTGSYPHVWRWPYNVSAPIVRSRTSEFDRP